MPSKTFRSTLIPPRKTLPSVSPAIAALLAGLHRLVLGERGEEVVVSRPGVLLDLGRAAADRDEAVASVLGTVDHAALHGRLQPADERATLVGLQLLAVLGERPLGGLEIDAVKAAREVGLLVTSALLGQVTPEIPPGR